MSDYTEISIHCPEEHSEILIAELYNLGYEGFWENETGFKAYINKNSFEYQVLSSLIEKHILLGNPIKYTLENIPHQNWNEKWESNYEPLIVAEKYLIKAPFHKIENPNLISFTISPKMAFGTGHHATTQLMMEMMLTQDFKNKSVIDLGTGTGLLAIFAEHLGAKKIVAIDNSPEAIDCSLENIKINHCEKIKASISDLKELKKGYFDIILANINRNILTENAANISARLKHGNYLIISGFYENDINYISLIFESVNLRFKTSISKNTWATCQFIKD
jgi:ribosomal protein L11 methyltransferase